ncbi:MULTISPECIES: hypothetical protein [Streptomyces]|uniref:Translation initiation factor IF-2 n=1 Tax=Streptomyces glycanivorans TaxID=3033808 RepID=A0ABY9JHE9_9ACTN|nr:MULTISPECIES: hypothetical protein [unclassified Streptomyces]WSQ79541.1 hypothetical protein OG725_21665 [Streptomyces sp. NBC_01213]WLQ66101.1 hypothetical protein P8A20_22085 [Streptomyces sp. Alt3]WSQ86921.1 hypothetical protein OG722_22345 [Streptomyces sp. NBC_01212]WSR07061.1 hypothetical protein OG265_14070 [Streptomyces sp. NBC_01208]WSR50197.1 hypothetical protein OG279_22350 [Streptomyces sp. NBC_01201]
MRTPVENWREGTRTGHTHEPGDVTVQLDGLGRQLSELPVEPAPPDPSDGPVFVDESGRRSKTYRRVGWVLAAVSAVYAVTLVVAVLGGNSSAPWLPLSGQDKKHAEEVEVRPAPSGDVVSESPGATPGAPASSASGSAAALASGGASASGSAAPAASAPASAAGKPTKGASTSSAPVPGAPVSEQPSGEPSPSVTTEPPVEESPPASPDPSESPVQPQEGTQ